jgi:DNA polymerase bacteriophage-type
MKHLHVDIETYSSVDLKKSGVYKYADAIDFEVLCIAYSYGVFVEVCDWKDLPWEVRKDLEDPKVQKLAHNATFERVCLSAMGLNVGNEWVCTAVLAGYNGLPMALKDVSEALDLGSKSKSAAGAALIRYFCMDVKPTKTNGGRTRNLPHHDPEKWEAFKEYCRQDVVAEMEIYNILKSNPLTSFEQKLYEVDQMINQNGVQVDLFFIEQVLHINEIDREQMNKRAQEITGLSNPNSNLQLRNWIEEQTGEEITSLAKGALATLSFDNAKVMELLDLRKQLSKTSVKKYDSMLACAMDDGRIRGLFQFYGANRTGRWAGRLVQVQNLPRNYMQDLDEARRVVKRGDYDTLTLLFSDIQDVLSQLIRTAFIPGKGSTHLTLSDYSAIEARVLAWLAKEKWRMDLFHSKEKRDIYKESASRMFNIPIDTMGDKDRQKGKVAELALGYQGGAKALEKMGEALGADLGLTYQEMEATVEAWRKANSAIVTFWQGMEDAAKKSIEYKKAVKYGRFVFTTNDKCMRIQLPSGRTLTYWKARLAPNRYGRSAIQYMWADTITRKWTWVDTYGGKIAENVTQAVARDFMAEAVVKVYEAGHSIVMHIHDEIVVENGSKEELEGLMKELPTWAVGFPLDAKGEEVKYFQK